MTVRYVGNYIWIPTNLFEIMITIISEIVLYFKVEQYTKDNESEIHSKAVTMCCKNRFDQCTLYICIAYYIWYYGTTDIRRHTPFTGL